MISTLKRPPRIQLSRLTSQTICDVMQRCSFASPSWSKGTHMRSCHRLTEGDRHQVHALYKVGLRKCAITEQIGVHKSTICREIHRDKCLHRYWPKQAHRLAFSQQAQIPRTRILDGIWTEIEKMIREDRSPEQINGHLSDYQYFSKHC